MGHRTKRNMHITARKCARLMAGAFVAMAGWNGAAACEEVAVLSTDARYFVLSGDTLEVTDGGNLWWLGIRGVDFVIPTSTLARAVLWMDSRVDLETGQW